ncbi:MAG: hypothetical protein ACYDCQ_13655 [Dehalococcoidia bacterium]
MTTESTPVSQPQQGDRIVSGAPPSFTWMESTTTEWGIRARPGPRGLRLADINIGSYGVVPDVWEFDTEIPRGAEPNPMAEGMGYSIFEKQEVWAESAADLYEDSIQARWAPSTDIPWSSLQPLPDEIEAAVCQLCTDLSQRAFASMTTLAKWLQQISYGFIEIKNYLSCEIFELARHTEAFRKRALANGGGLGLQPPNNLVQRHCESMNFSEALFCIALVDAAFLDALYSAGGDLAQDDAERELYQRCLADTRRHLRYGVDHLKWIMDHKPSRTLELQRYFAKAEQSMVQDLEQPLASEPLLVLFGGGLNGIDRGAARLHELRRAQVDRYLAALSEGGLDHASFPLNSHLAAYRSS